MVSERISKELINAAIDARVGVGSCFDLTHPIQYAVYYVAAVVVVVVVVLEGRFMDLSLTSISAWPL